MTRFLIDAFEMLFAIGMAAVMANVLGTGGTGFAVALASYGCWTAIRAASAHRAASRDKGAA